MSDRRNFNHLDRAEIKEMVKKLFKDKSGKVTPSLIDHVRTLVNRHADACRQYDIDPEIERTVIEAVEDYRLKRKTGISVLDQAPEDAALPVQRLLQYVSPRRNEL